jgi:hypothetical protein
MNRLDTTHAANVGNAIETQHDSYTSSINAQRAKITNWLSSEERATLDHLEHKAPEFSVMLFIGSGS